MEFDLATIAPDFDEEVPVPVRGAGRGFLVAAMLAGTTEEWRALEPSTGGLEGVRLRGVELPVRAGRKILSSSQASSDPDGAFHILLQNCPVEKDGPSTTVPEARREPED